MTLQATLEFRLQRYKKRTEFSPSFLHSKIENILKFLIKRDADDERELGGGVELPCLDRADSVSRYADHICKLLLRNILLKSYRLKVVLQYKLIVHKLPLAYNKQRYCKEHSDSKCNYTGDKVITLLKLSV